MSGMRERVQRIQQLAKGAAAAEALQVDVLELVNWVYGDQRAHLIDGRGIGLHEGERAAEGLGGGISADGLVRLARIGALGCMVDKIGYDAGDLHPVAETVHDLVIHHAGISVIQFAARKSIPPGAGLIARLGPQWKEKPAYDHRGGPLPGSFVVRHDKHRQPSYCPLVPDFGPDYLAELRAEYVAWHDALGFLVRACRAARHRLGGIIVMPTKLQREPWRDDAPAESPCEAESPRERRPGLLAEHLALLRLLDQPKRWFNLGEIVMRRGAPKVAAEAMQWLIDQGLVDRFADTQHVRLSAEGRQVIGAFD